MMKHRIEIFEGKPLRGEDEEIFERYWYWRLIHINGHKLATSEAYTRRSTALRVAKRVADAGRFGLVDFTVRAKKK